MNEREIHALGLYVEAADQPHWRRRFEVGAQVRIRRHRRLGRVAAVLERDGAGAPARVAVRWNAPRATGAHELPIDFLELVERTGADAGAPG